MNREYAPRNTESKATRSQFVTVAFDPKRRFALELLARKDGRTVSNVIGLAVERLLQNEAYYEGGKPTLMTELLEEIWSPIEADRIVKLADRLPEKLSFEEEIVWVLIQSRQEFWHKSLSEGSSNVSRATFNFERLREQWETLKAEAAKKAAKEAAVRPGARIRQK